MSTRTFALTLGLCLVTAVAFAADGRKVFEDEGCTMCHKAKEDSIGPALSKIANHYAEKKADLEKFFAGEAKPAMKPGMFGIMKPNLHRIQALSKEQRSALADYILSQK
jgi:cytochrome c